MGTCVNCGVVMQGEGTLCERCLEEADAVADESLPGIEALAISGDASTAGPNVDAVPLPAPWRKYLRPALAVGAVLLLVGGAFVVVKLYKNGQPGGVDADEMLQKANTLLDPAHAAGAHPADAVKVVGGSTLRLTQKVREQLLALNEGFTWTTHNSQRNFTEDRVYKIVNNQLHIFAEGKTSWAHSRYAKEWVATAEETHRFLRNYLDVLNTDGIG